VVVHTRGELPGVVPKRRNAPVRGGAELNPMSRRRTIGLRGESLTATDDAPNGAVETPRRQCNQGRPRCAGPLRPEGAAYVWTDHTHLTHVHPKLMCYFAPEPEHRLGGLVERQLPSIPQGRRREQLDRVVRLG